MIRNFLFRLFGMAALSVLCVSPLSAQDSEDATDESTEVTPPKSKKSIPKNLKPVAQAIAEMNTFNAKPDLKAKYYIYIVSASWCGICKHIMPKVAEIYPAMKKKHVELLLVGADGSLEEAKKYAASYNNKAKIPSIWQRDPENKKPPGFVGGPGIPWVVYVSADGETVEASTAVNKEKGILNWEKVLFDKKSGNKKNKK